MAVVTSKVTSKHTASEVSRSDVINRCTPAAYARQLLDSLGLKSVPLATPDNRSADQLWAESGAMWLTGHAESEPLSCSAPLAACAQGVWLALSSLYPDTFDAQFPAHKLLAERAAIAGLSRQGRRSAGGACRLYKTLNGYLALNLVRDDDWDLLHAWLEQPVDTEPALVAAVAEKATDDLIDRARILGLAAAPLTRPLPCDHWFQSTRVLSAVEPPRHSPLVIDLTSLWAGPLCGSLLSMAGARVIKVESTQRPDGARFGPENFYHLMNAGKESVALDLNSDDGRSALRALLSHADIVLEAARPRGLEQMGIFAHDLLSARGGMTWLSITGYGRQEPMRNWIAYGDDAGIAAGLGWLMVRDQQDPVFCGDAIADPLTGLHAALLALTDWHKGGGRLLDISLHGVVAHCIASGISDSESSMGLTTPIGKPICRPQAAKASDLGQDTARILKEFL